jgi:subtilisin family serine protease
VLRALSRSADTSSEQDAIPGQIVGVWASDLGLDAQAVARAAQAQLLVAAPLPALTLELVVLEVPAERVDERLAQLRAAFPQATFGPQLVYSPQQDAAASAAPVHYALHLIRAPDPPPALPAPVTIGVVDGLPPPDLALAASVERIPLQSPDAVSTHAAAVGCVLACAPAGGLTGLARGARLVFAGVLKRAGERERSDTATVARALDVLAARRVAIVHMSLGAGSADAVLSRVVERLLPHIRAFVAAAGNGAKRAPPYPASQTGVIAVAAVDARAKPWRDGTRGTHIALAAPGVDVWLPVAGGRYFTGSSYAAPFVTAALAHLLAKDKPATAASLCAHALDVPPAGRDDATGCGVLQWPKDDASR